MSQVVRVPVPWSVLLLSGAPFRWAGLECCYPLSLSLLIADAVGYILYVAMHWPVVSLAWPFIPTSPGFVGVFAFILAYFLLSWPLYSCDSCGVAYCSEARRWVERSAENCWCSFGRNTFDRCVAQYWWNASLSFIHGILSVSLKSCSKICSTASFPVSRVALVALYPKWRC